MEYEDCEHKFRVESIDQWTGDGVKGSARCEECGEYTGFEVDIYDLIDALNESTHLVDFEDPEFY